MNKVFEIIINTIQTVEKEIGSGQGETKKEKAVNIINNLIDIPIIPEFLEEKVFSLIIDLVVFIFNKYEIFKK